MKYKTIPSALPIEYENKWIKLYRKPWALSLDDWEIFDAEVKKKHPIQYFFRETVPITFGRIGVSILNFKWAIRNYFINPRKEMRAAVFPARYQDLPEIIFEFHCQVIKEFVEREKYFDIFCTEHNTKRSSFEKNLNKYYCYINETRPKLLVEMDCALKPKLRNKFSNNIKKLDNQMMLWVIKHQEYFWT